MKRKVHTRFSECTANRAAHELLCDTIPSECKKVTGLLRFFDLMMQKHTRIKNLRRKNMKLSLAYLSLRILLNATICHTSITGVVIDRKICALQTAQKFFTFISSIIKLESSCVTCVLLDSQTRIACLISCSDSETRV